MEYMRLNPMARREVRILTTRSWELYVNHLQGSLHGRQGRVFKGAERAEQRKTNSNITASKKTET
jgi:hypothetical protein